ncbi:uncharacterized protein PF3D7_1120600-like [Linepithema humile]|uniref:uncharacterized protein PF3D7_1120600-like n=1 Tax=Linepithema humile TaxID=83485 RepID=UPI00351F6348
MADNDNSTEPPVPPRRTKRKIKTTPIALSVASSDAIEATKHDATLQQKHSPPPLPPPPEICRRNKSRSVVETSQPQCDTATSCPRAESVSGQHHGENRTVDTATDVIDAKSPESRDDTISASENSAMSDNVNDDPVSKSTAPKPPFLPSLDVTSSKRRALNKYPPLFFTLRDFEDVMSSTYNRDDFANGSSANLADLHDKESSTVSMLNVGDDVCFRVTTTNRPFEKCLGKWKDPFNDDDFVQKLDDYRFENRTDKSDQINVKKSSGYDIFDNNNPTITTNENPDYRAGMKVRFAIESPNPSTSEYDLNIKIGVPCDSSRSCESILYDEQAGEQSTTSSVKSTEIREKFADIKDCGGNSGDKSYTSNNEKENSATRENDAFLLTDTNKVDTILKRIPQTCFDDRNNDINCEKIRKNDSNVISWDEHNENLKIEKKNILMSVKTITSEEYAAKQKDENEILNVSSELTENTCRFIDKSLETAYRDEKVNAAEITQKITQQEKEIFLEKTSADIKEKCVAENKNIFVKDSIQSFSNDHVDDNVNQHNSEDESRMKRISIDNLTDKSLRIKETRQMSIEENKETSEFLESKNNREELSPSEEIFVKNVPVKVRRNSFLETMLSDDSADISINCAVICKQTPSNIDKELSTPNVLTNKVGEFDTDITKESEHFCDFNNVIKTATANQVLKDSKGTKEKVTKNAGDVKNDVLNELLCNFSNIKLKIVSPENKKPALKISGDESIACSVAIDNGLSKGKESESPNLQMFKKSQSEVYNVPINVKTVDIRNDATSVEKIVKEKKFIKIEVEDKPQDLKNNHHNAANDEKIANNKNIERTKREELSCSIKDKITKNSSLNIKVDEKSSDIKSEETCVRIKTEETFKSAKNAGDAKRESKKPRDIRAPKTILKKTSAERERQRTSKFQERIPIGAPATMNKIFDSKELETIADASRRSSLRDGRIYETTSRETHDRGGKKTDEEVNADDGADVDRQRIASRSALALVENTTGSSDKCAIARKTISVTPCNNNDNNRAVTPVANVSNDQSPRDVVTITPGKVRSFVKYYEIRGDVTTAERHSKINNREKVARCKSTKSQAAPVAARNPQRPEVITVKKGKANGGRSIKSNDGDILRKTFNNAQSSTFASIVPEHLPDISICKTTEMKSKVMKEYEKTASYVFDKEMHKPLAKVSAKKSVQFLGDFTIIHSETFDGKESTVIADHEANASRKRKAPGIPRSRDFDGCQKLVHEITKMEKLPDTEKSSFQQRETVAQIHTVAGHGENSGINRFVPKPEIPQLVFYCTI